MIDTENAGRRSLSSGSAHVPGDPISPHIVPGAVVVVFFSIGKRVDRSQLCSRSRACACLTSAAHWAMGR
jgi:hypothetical protein